MPHGSRRARQMRAGMDALAPLSDDGDVELLDRIQLGQMAEELRKSPAFEAMFKAARKQLTRDWQTSQPGERDKREQIYFTLHALGWLEDACKGIETAGKVNASRGYTESILA